MTPKTDSYEAHLPPHTCTPADLDEIWSRFDPGALFRIDPDALRARAVTDYEFAITEQRRLARKIAAYNRLIAAMWELRELGEADFG